MYKQYINQITGEIYTHGIIRTTDGACIPFDPANMDFVEYNKWLSEGNIPLPPDEPTLP
jgi:hypothetical protein